jgi:hypothetical protein
MKRSCVFCQDGLGTTADHIPPKGFFSKPWPSNLITVPCCEECRLRDQKHDEFLRNLFVSFRETENHPSVASQLAARRDRSFDKDSSKAKTLLKIVVPVQVSGPAGNVLGTDTAFNVDDPRVSSFIERVSRGVLYDSFGLTYFRASCDWDVNPQIPERLLTHAPPPCKQKTISNIFWYLAAPCNGHGVFKIFLRFYQNLLIISRLTKS